MKHISIKRIYEAPAKSDGVRILVDRLWPRGVSKEKADIDYWFKDVAPSTDLRKWFNHNPERFDEFKKYYLDELKQPNQELEQIKEILKTKNVTLLYGAKDPKINHSVVLANFLKE